MTTENTPTTPPFKVGDVVFLKGQSDPIVFLTVLNPEQPTIVDIDDGTSEGWKTVSEVYVAGFNSSGTPFRFSAPAAALTSEWPH